MNIYSRLLKVGEVFSPQSNFRLHHGLDYAGLSWLNFHSCFAQVVNHVPIQFSCSEAWQELPCCGEACYRPVVGRCCTLVGILPCVSSWLMEALSAIMWDSCLPVPSALSAWDPLCWLPRPVIFLGPAPRSTSNHLSLVLCEASSPRFPSSIALGESDVVTLLLCSWDHSLDSSMRKNLLLPGEVPDSHFMALAHCCNYSASMCWWLMCWCA